jgi:F-type H+-transporting ATPase subunit epsilon
MAELTMRLKVVSPERILFDDEVREFVIDTKSGQITVLPNHIPLVTILKAGEVLIRKEGKETPLVISGGVLELTQKQAVVLADTAEHVSELDVERAQRAVDLAKKLMAEKKFDLYEYETLRANLSKHQARVSAFTKWRR